MIKLATVNFDSEGTPWSKDYGDVYFSSDGGLAESEYVFLHHNQLQARFNALKPGSTFVIAETGFGSGLNFLLTWQLFLTHAPSTAKLHYISCEKYPLSAADLQQSHMQAPSLAALAKQLQHHYPIPMQGFHSHDFDTVTLQLLFDDAASALAQLNARVDAWFLDGFSPAKNPDMWTPELFAEIGRLSRSNTSLATFSSARVVKQGLAGVGFKLTKHSGYGLKREILSARYVGICGPKPETGWPSSPLATPPSTMANSITIIGAGIAGAHTARAFAEAGFQVTVYEQAKEPAQGGSGNRQGAVYAKLSATPTIATQFYSQALITAQQWLAALPSTVPHAVSGLVQLVHDDRELKRLEEMANSDYVPQQLAKVLNATELSQKIGINVDAPGLWFANGGWVSPTLAVAHLLDHQNINCRFEHQLIALEQDDQGWQLMFTNQTEASAEQIVLCSSYDTTALPQTAHLPLNAIAGQVTQIAPSQHSNALKAVICTDRYVMPALEGQVTIGSTFRLKSTNTEILSNEDDENIKSLTERLPSLLPDRPTVLGHRAGVRCTTPDYLPLVGPIANAEQFLEQFTLPIQRNRAHRCAPADYLNGLWVNTGHGSKGLCSTALSARLLVAMVTGNPYPVPQPVCDALNPNRFLIRQILRAKRQKSASRTHTR